MLFLSSFPCAIDLLVFGGLWSLKRHVGRIATIVKIGCSERAASSPQAYGKHGAHSCDSFKSEWQYQDCLYHHNSRRRRPMEHSVQNIMDILKTSYGWQ